MIVMPVAMFLIKQFIDQTPNELIESAKIDGASEMEIFFSSLLALMSSLEPKAFLSVMKTLTE